MIGVKVVHTKMMTVEKDGHYLGDLVNGARLADYWGDVGTELMIRATGDGSLFRAYKEMEFLAPIHIGDFIEYHGWIEKAGNTSFEVHFEAWKTITTSDDWKIDLNFVDGIIGEPNLKGFKNYYVLEEPILCGRAIGTMVVPKELRRPSDPRFVIE